MYDCKKVTLYPPKNFLKRNVYEGYLDSVVVDACLAEEIEELWSKGIRTTGCCCGHGKYVGNICVGSECIPMMKDLGYVNAVIETMFEGDMHDHIRDDIFIAKSYGHLLEGR